MYIISIWKFCCILCRIPLFYPPTFRIFWAVGEVNSDLYSSILKILFFLCAVYLIFELLHHLSPPFSAATWCFRQNQEHRASSYRQASESPPHPFQGCVGPLSACHLGFFHNISNSRRMTWATYHTPQAAVVDFKK